MLLAFGPVFGVLPGLAGVLFSALGIGQAVKLDRGMSRSLAGLGFSVVALIAVVISVGGHASAHLV